MIVKDTATLRNFISVNGSVTHENVKPYLAKAERKFLKPMIGKDQLAAFDTEQTDDIIKEAQELAQEVVSNYGYYLYLPIGAVQITDAGIMVADSENARPASDKQFKELQRSFLKSAHEALDELLSFMELSADKFPEWFSSDSKTVYDELLVNKTSIFNEHYYIFESHQTFIALKPTLKTVEDQFIVPSIGSSLLEALKNNQTDEIRKSAKKLIQKAIVSFTVMKTVYNGMFILDAKGMHMRFDVLPYEKTVTNINLKVNDFLVHTKSTKETEGEEYLKLAIDLIEANPDSFTEYVKNETSQPATLIVTKSIIGM